MCQHHLPIFSDPKHTSRHRRQTLEVSRTPIIAVLTKHILLSMKSTTRRKPNQGYTDSRDPDQQIYSERESLPSPSAPSRSGSPYQTTATASASRHSKSRRTATLYDAVAGRIGTQGFLKPEQTASSQTKPSAPEEVLLRRVNAPDKISWDYYNADERLGGEDKGLLPESDLVKEIHTYVADYYELTNDGVGAGQHKVDIQSMDETALLAMGILLEEACKDALGENGDMVFSEPARHDWEVPRSRLAQYQVIGKVVPEKVQEYQSSSGASEDDGDVDAVVSRPRKRQRRRYHDPDEV